MDIDEGLKNAIIHFWRTRERQGDSQGKDGRRDQGARSKVTGGRQLDGVLEFLCGLLIDSGVPAQAIFWRGSGRTLPGWCRPAKQWDLIVVHDKKLIAVVECKSQIGSIGNNANNRAEEFVGLAVDHRKAHEETAFGASPPPWIAFFMLFEDSDETRAPGRDRGDHFTVLPEFRGASYVDRYRIAFQKLIRAGFYDAIAFILTRPEKGIDGDFSEPADDLSFKRFVGRLVGHCSGFFKFEGCR